LSTLFDHSCADHRDLHSFPTRRSSDLAKMALAMLSAMSVAELKMHVEQESESALTRIPGIGKKTAQRLLIELKDKLKNIEVDSRDRKSTRLNSSHVKISYAVFCLKKKN